MKTYIVQLDEQDDVISTRDKVSWSKARRVVLVWPRQGNILERGVDLLLLQRYSEQVGRQIALVTRSSVVKTNARELGIPVFKSPIRAQKTAWRSMRVKPVFADQNPAPRTAPANLRTMRSDLNTPTRLSRPLRWSVFTTAIIAFLALVLFFIPSATVKLSPIKQDQSLVMAVWASPAINIPNLSGGMPAYELDVIVEGREMAASTSRTLVADQAARGQIEIANLTDRPVHVPQGSVVLTGGTTPVRFTTSLPIDLPGNPGDKLLVSVLAEQPGSSGNVGAGQIQSFEGPLGMRVLVTNPAPTSGGSDRAVPAPSPADYAHLRSKLMGQLQQNALDELRAQLSSGQRMLDPTLTVKQVIKEEREPEANQPGDQLRLTMQVNYSTWYVKDSDLNQIGQSVLDANLPKGFKPTQGSLQVDFLSLARVDSQPLNSATLNSAESARWEMMVKRQVEAELPKDRVLALVQGQSPAGAVQRLAASLPLKDPPQVELYPAWWVRMPFFAYRIAVVQP